MWSVSSGVVSSMAGIFEWIECTHIGCIDDATIVCVCAARWAGRLMACPGIWWSTQSWIVVPPRLSRRCHIHNHRILFTISNIKNQRNFFLHTAFAFSRFIFSFSFFLLKFLYCFCYYHALIGLWFVCCWSIYMGFLDSVCFLFFVHELHDDHDGFFIKKTFAHHFILWFYFYWFYLFAFLFLLGIFVSFVL